MKQPIQITEYGAFCRKKGIQDCKYLPEDTFNKLENFILANQGSETDPVELMGLSVRRDAGKIITAKNYVGMIAMNDGTVIEILPKICNIKDDENGEKAKKLLVKMLNTLRNSPLKNFQTTSVDTSKLNIFEIFIKMFNEEVFKIVKHGLRCNYETKTENLNVFKGKMKFAEQIKYNLIHKERSYVEYDEFNVNTSENRLIKTTLQYLYKRTVSDKNKSDIRTLLNSFNDVDASSNVEKDFISCGKDRNMKNYKFALSWCRVFLKGESFTSYSGSEVAYALLFPMETLFESYVASNLKRIIDPREYSVSMQDRGYYLFDNPSKFALRPDIVVTRKSDNAVFVMDTKWKLLTDNPSTNYGISQADMYQMYAYQKKYESENVTLIYPLSDRINPNADISYKSDDDVIVDVTFVDLMNIRESLKRIIEEI